MSREKIFNLKAMGAEVVLTRSDVHKGHPEYYQDYAARLSNGGDGQAAQGAPQLPAGRPVSREETVVVAPKQ